MRDVVYLPAYDPMPVAALARLADLVNTVELRERSRPRDSIN
jgi:hypothetical protein